MSSMRSSYIRTEKTSLFCHEIAHRRHFPLLFACSHHFHDSANRIFFLVSGRCTRAICLHSPFRFVRWNVRILFFVLPPILDQNTKSRISWSVFKQENLLFFQRFFTYFFAYQHLCRWRLPTHVSTKLRIGCRSDDRRKKKLLEKSFNELQQFLLFFCVTDEVWTNIGACKHLRMHPFSANLIRLR